MKVAVTVNGEAYQVDIPPRMTLADALRMEMGLTGTHLGCEQGACGACTVLLNGVPVRSCLMFGVQADGHEVTTIEGLSSEVDDLHPLQQAFLAHRAFQCGFCTPGILMNFAATLQDTDTMTRQDVREHLSGHICRCTGYVAILDAVCEVLDRAGKLDESEGV